MFDDSLLAAQEISLRLENHPSAHTAALTVIDRLAVAKTLFDFGYHHSGDENELQRQAKSLNRCGISRSINNYLMSCRLFSQISNELPTLADTDPISRSGYILDLWIAVDKVQSALTHALTLIHQSTCLLEVCACPW